jgi:hypothetical protein
MHVQNLAVEDYFVLPNALADGASVDATVSFDVVWSGPITRRLNFQNSTAVDPFAGEFVENQLTVSWSGSNANGFSFTSNPGNFSTSVDTFAELSHDRNGSFFTAGSVPPAAALSAGSALSTFPATRGDQEVTALLANILAARSQTSPIPAGNGSAAMAPVPASFTSQPSLLLGTGSGNSATTLSLTPHSLASSTALQDHVFATIAVNPLDHGPYQGLLSDPAVP